MEGLLAWLPHLPAYGPAAAEYLTLLQSLLEQKLSKGKRGGHAGDAEHKPPKYVAFILHFLCNRPLQSYA